jgi:hypothetical protein
MTPSQDSVGRAFPLLAVTTVPAEAGTSIACAPVAGVEFFLGSEAALGDARASGVVSHATHALPTLPSIEADALTAASVDFRSWSAETKLVHKLWKDLFPRRRGTAALSVLGALVDAGADLRESGGARHYVRLPLGSGGPAAASFWLHVLSAVAGAERVAVVAWTRSSGGTVLAALGGEPPVDFLLRLWLAERRSPDTVDGVRVDNAGSADPQLPATIANVVTSRESSVDDLLSALARG